jgi:triosephosphate isomerase
MSPNLKPRGVLIAGNWKMNHGPSETSRFFEGVKSTWDRVLSKDTQAAYRDDRLRAWVCPPAISLSVAVRAAAEPRFGVAAQNTHWEKAGAFTGELSGPMLQELGVRASLVGHSERRQYFGETDETARKRTESLLEQGFSVILCVGETRAEREREETLAVLTRQLRGALPEAGRGAARFLDGRLILAYEPVWAIGTGLTATPAQAEEAHQALRKQLWDAFGLEAAGRTPILYGGSVTPDNAPTLLGQPNVDGALVGGASLKPESFLALLEAGGRAITQAP